ncbi:winged helix repair factor 1-like isoform X2 [Lycorma delicatula]|uniref:winged helix repair factor 1-like isoform X2 n=1 Tax=Lycorma delicatula TaxID=130591 RepID=UPI003F50E2E9
MNKRKISDYYGFKKRPYGITHNYLESETNNCDIGSTLQELKKTFKQNDKNPPIIFVHQFYSFIKCRTTVDKQINALQACGKVRLFKLGIDECSLALVVTDDLIEFLNKSYSSNHSIKKFIKVIIPEVRDVCVEKALLKEKFKLTDRDISEFINAGLLTVKSELSYWFSIPSVGEFVKTFIKGRKAVMRTIRKCKYSEILITCRYNQWNCSSVCKNAIYKQKEVII